ncbi:hypothetical protein FSARC_9762 [Fusarium sarcochroum]|uniref:GPI anchored serine-threonine rich protein n=1 Tax=Fusarium sarcochroum TaxID=1208366 RepID=A0A8H4TQC2_9HYPO|nr:hypothetical protein FSARC_9762 [Fusarium sarcochroum]
MNKVILFALSASGALASVNYSPSFPILVARQVVEVPCADQNLKDCGTGCIQLDWTCCPSKAGGCPPTAYCEVGTNSQYGCCPNGSVCNGVGGGTTRGSTNTLTLAGGETTTVVQGTVVESSMNTAATDAPVLEGSSTAVIVPPVPDTMVSDTNTASSVPPVVPDPNNSASVPPVVPTAPAPVVPGPNDTPVPTVPTPSSVVVNGGSSNGYSLFGGIMAGLAALLI